MISIYDLALCSLAEQLESIRESLDERGASALTLFLECKKVNNFSLEKCQICYYDGWKLTCDNLQ